MCGCVSLKEDTCAGVPEKKRSKKSEMVPIETVPGAAAVVLQCTFGRHAACMLPFLAQ